MSIFWQRSRAWLALALLVPALAGCRPAATEAPATRPSGDSGTVAATLPPLVATNTPVPSSVDTQLIAGLEIPVGWFARLEQPETLHGILFVSQPPSELAAFEHPELAVPADFAGGAVIRAPLPIDANPGALHAGAKASLDSLGDEDLAALLVAVDEVGLLNLTAVAETKLERARLDRWGGREAIVLEGRISFIDERPPMVHCEVWLTWTDREFVSFYALAAEDVWLDTRAAFDTARQSPGLP